MTSLAEADRLLTAPGAEFEIKVENIRGIPTRTWSGQPPTLRAILENSRSYGDGTWLVYEDERLTFQEHYRLVVRAARALEARAGVAKGDRVAIAMRNYPEWVVTFFAATSLGAIVVPLNAWWTGEEMHYGLSDSGAVVLVADGERLERIAPHLDDLDVRRVVAVRTDDLPEGGEDCGVEHWADFLGEELLGEGPGGVDGAGEMLPGVDLEPDDDATIFYTSGTTGFPKGALGTHRNICTNVRTLQFLKARGELRKGIEPPDVDYASLLSVPLFHVTGCHSTMVPALANGAKLVLVYRFDPDETLRIIEREKITGFGGVPTLVWKVLECETFGTTDTSSVLRIGYGGAPAAPELVRRLQEHFPDATPSNGYGLTETSAVSSSNAGDTYALKPASCGPTVPVCVGKIVDVNGEELPRGETGELWLHGANVIKGYWNKPEATAEAFTEGWLHTGDLATMDEDGFITIVDRAKDMVIRGGENIYCVEVEAALFEHPDVLDAAVYGVPDRVLGEEVAASVQLRGETVIGEASSAGLAEWLAARIAKFKVPKEWHLTHEHFPRNANGKTMKRSLRAAALERLGRSES